MLSASEKDKILLFAIIFAISDFQFLDLLVVVVHLKEFGFSSVIYDSFVRQQ